jgi:hypothetical protein
VYHAGYDEQNNIFVANFMFFKFRQGIILFLNINSWNINLIIVSYGEIKNNTISKFMTKKGTRMPF